MCPMDSIYFYHFIIIYRFIVSTRQRQIGSKDRDLEFRSDNTEENIKCKILIYHICIFQQSRNLQGVVVPMTV